MADRVRHFKEEVEDEEQEERKRGKKDSARVTKSRAAMASKKSARVPLSCRLQ